MALLSRAAHARGISPRIIWRAIFGAAFKNTCRAQVFRVEIDRIARKHFRVAIDRMRTAARRRFAKLFALRFAIVGMRYECAGYG